MKNLIFLLFASICFADVREIHSFAEAKKEILQGGPDHLVIFDVDEVLLIPQDVLLRQNRKENGIIWYQAMGELEEEKLHHLLSIALLKIKYQLVDSDLPSFLKEIQKTGTKTIALTSARTGKLGLIPSADQWRLDQLKELNIDFRTPYHDLSFPEMVKEGENPPLFREGVLFLGDLFDLHKSAKGALLGSFFEKVKWKPKKIFFFDDKMDNVLSVEKEAQERGIAFQGYHFKGADFVEGELNEKLATLQCHHLKENNEWLNDREAAQLLQQKD